MRFHPAFWLALGIAISMGLIREYLLILAVVTLHEMTHVIVGLIFNLKLREIIITPLGAAAVLKGLELKPPWVRAIVILSGPLMNLVIGIVGFRLFSITDIAMPETGFGLGYFFAANLALGAFNMLPALPLDGGRFWQLALGSALGVARANRFICRTIRAVAYLLIFLGLIQVILYPFNLSLYCVGVYILKNLPKEQIKLSFEFFCYFSSSRRSVQRVVPMKFFEASPSMEVESLIDCLRWDSFTVFHVYLEDSAIVSITEKELMSYIKDRGLNGCVSEMLFD
jgi:stage IV sporulation protein FB